MILEVTLKIQLQLFHGPWHDSVGEHTHAQPFRMWNKLRFHPFLQVSQIFQRRKSDTNKLDFENEFIFDMSNSINPKNNRDLTQYLLHLWSKFGDPSWNGCWVIALTDLVTDGRTQAKTIPEIQYWPRVKKKPAIPSIRAVTHHPTRMDASK